MTSAERNRKSREKKFLKMSEDEKLEFKAKERERSKKTMQAKRLKDRIKALRNKKRASTEQTSKEKAKALLQKASTKHKNPYKGRQSFSKAMNKVRVDLPSS